MLVAAIRPDLLLPGNYIAFGCNGDDTGATNAGTVWVFSYSAAAAAGSRWTVMTGMPIQESPVVGQVGFGEALALSGTSESHYPDL